MKEEVSTCEALLSSNIASLCDMGSCNRLHEEEWHSHLNAPVQRGNSWSNVMEEQEVSIEHLEEIVREGRHRASWAEKAQLHSHLLNGSCREAAFHSTTARFWDHYRWPNTTLASVDLYPLRHAHAITVPSSASTNPACRQCGNFVVSIKIATPQR